MVSVGNHGLQICRAGQLSASGHARRCTAGPCDRGRTAQGRPLWYWTVNRRLSQTGGSGRATISFRRGAAVRLTRPRRARIPPHPGATTGRAHARPPGRLPLLLLKDQYNEYITRSGCLAYAAKLAANRTNVAPCRRGCPALRRASSPAAAAASRFGPLLHGPAAHSGACWHSRLAGGSPAPGKWQALRRRLHQDACTRLKTDPTTLIREGGAPGRPAAPPLTTARTVARSHQCRPLHRCGRNLLRPRDLQLARCAAPAAEAGNSSRPSVKRPRQKRREHGQPGPHR